MREDTSVSRRECAKKEYALLRLRVATVRLMRADSAAEKAIATDWVNAWASAIGNRHFHEFVKGHAGYNRLRR